MVSKYLEVTPGLMDEGVRNEYELKAWVGAGDKICSLIGKWQY